MSSDIIVSVGITECYVTVTDYYNIIIFYRDILHTIILIIANTLGCSCMSENDGKLYVGINKLALHDTYSCF